VAVAAALAALGVALVGCGGGDDDDTATTEAPEEQAAQDIGRALAGASDGSTSAPDGGEGDGGAADDAAADAEAADAGADGPEPPPVTIPPSASPPTTAPGTEAGSIPGADGDDPLFGQIVVDLEPDGYLDFPVQLREGQHIQVISAADDGVSSRTVVYGPDGEPVGDWNSTGREGEITGYYWDDNDRLPATGTYVVRVEHVGGADRPFVIAFYGEA
jgi:hypothetical protein